MNTERLDALMASYVPHQIPAVVVGVHYQGKRVLEKAYGVLDPETGQRPTSLDTLFDIASLTKLYTTTAFLQHVSAGRVTLQTPLVAVVPEFGGNPRSIDGGQDPHTKQPLPTPIENQGILVDPQKVTFWHLLTHTSGIAPWRDVFNQAGEAPPLPTLADEAQVDRWKRGLSAICQYPFVSAVDGVVRYSDLGLMLLGEAVARLSGVKSLEEALHPLFDSEMHPLFNPVRAYGVPLERIAPTEQDSIWRKRRVWGEVHDENACGVGGVAGHAGLFATMQDVLTLGVRWLQHDHRLHISDGLIQEATRTQAETNGERRGLGWMIRSLSGSSAGDLFSVETYGHTGFVGTSLYIDPVHEIVVALMTNGVYYGRDIMPTYAFRRAVHHWVAEELLS